MHANGQPELFVQNEHQSTVAASDLLATQRQLAFIFKLSSSAISRWPLQPVRRFGREVYYSVAEAVSLRFADDGRLDLGQERARLAAAQADRAVLDNAARAAVLIRLEEAMQVFSTQIAQAKNLLLGMGAKLATELCGAVGLPATSAPDLEEIIDREVREILEELSGQRAAVDLGVPDDSCPEDPPAETEAPAPTKRRRRSKKAASDE